MTIDLDDADLTDAINAFLHVLNRQRALGLCPRTEHMLAERLLRGDVGILYYSNSKDVFSIVESKSADDDEFDDTMEIIELIAKRRTRQKEARAAADALSSEGGGAGPDDEGAPPQDGAQ